MVTSSTENLFIRVFKKGNMWLFPVCQNPQIFLPSALLEKGLQQNCL